MNNFTYKKRNRIKALSAVMSDFSYKKHSHDEYAIGVTKRGIQHYYLDGSLQLSHQNGIMFFNPEQVHDGMAYGDSDLEYIMLYIEPSLLLEAIERKDYIRFSSPIIYNRSIQKNILYLFEAIFNEESEDICDELFLKFADSLTGYESNIIQNQDQLIQRIKKEIISARKFEIETISNNIGMSKFQFIRYFNAQTGITPYQFFLNAKVEGARVILEQERDVHLAVNEFNFVDTSHLNRQFKKIYGITVNDYVNQIS